MSYQKIRFVLGDQLNQNHSWYQTVDDKTLYVIAELNQEATYVTHHVQKICAFFAAMQYFSEMLKENGHDVHYLTLDETASFTDLRSLIVHLCLEHQVTQFEYQQPDEFRLKQSFEQLNLPIPVKCVDTEHFLVSFGDLPEYFPSNTSLVMEHFYRKMRKKWRILIDENNKPLGGKWNYDQKNRQKLKPIDIEMLPSPLLFSNDVSSIITRLEKHQIKTIGKIETSLLWPINREQSLSLLHYFCQYCLPYFGVFQDAMTTYSPHAWSLYHSRLSFSLNAKLLSPEEVVMTALQYFEQTKNDISLAQIEGFIRQIIGWREYIRGIYWANMPDYQTKNSLNATRPLPTFYWTGDTKMQCLKYAITQSLDYSYAHHIQRLMITGNFALLAGCSPDEVEQWYLGIYIDAIEWVEMPNTRGMALFADDGIMATKPYASSGAYINKMSDYCQSCHYKVKEKIGERACPFNSLYWHFLDRHDEKFSKNHRMRMIYSVWDNFEQDLKKEILDQAEKYISKIDTL